MFNTSFATGNKVQTRNFVIKGNQYNYLITAKRMQYKSFNSLVWGKITYSGALLHNKEGITPASCSRFTLLSQLKIIDNSPKGMFL
jgi:hypothetical protein